MPIINPNINFSKPFSKSALIAFAYDTPTSISLVRLQATLPKPSVSVQLSRVSSVTVSAALSKPSVSVQLSRVSSVTVSAALSKPSVSCFIQYDNNVWRGVQNTASLVFDETAPLKEKSISTEWKGTSVLNKMNRVEWRDSDSIENKTSIFTNQALPLSSSVTSVFTGSEQLNNSKRDSFDGMIPVYSTKALLWDESNPVNAAIGSSSDQGIPINLSKSSKWDNSKPLSDYWITSCDVSVPLKRNFEIIFDETERMPGAFWTRPDDPETQEPPDIRSTDIVFGDRLFEYTTSIVFGIKTPSNKIISKKVYYMLHSFYLRRVSDNTPIQISRINGNISQSDYTWGFDFNVIGTDSFNKLVEYSPMELELMVNGWKWRMLVTDIRKSHKFGSNTYSATGVGLSGYLSDLYSDKRNRTETSEMTVQQLAISETNGTLFTLDWQAGNWLVPGNTYSYQDRTPIEAISDIVSSAGAFILPDRELLKLTVKPKFPVAPWLFNTLVPDLSMSPEPIISRDRSFRKMPDWNSVWISGTTPSGIMASVTRTGSAGDRQPNAPITHQIITNPDGARAKGIRFLGDNLDRYEHRLVLPLTNDVPLIQEGILIQVNDTTPWRGLVTGTGISVSLSDRAVTVRQTIEIEEYQL